MSETVIKVERLSKKYQLGTIGYGSLAKDLSTWWAKVRGKEDPNAVIGSRSKLEVHRDFWALRDVDFCVEKGNRVGIIGKNGAGKSTLLKILSRITRPTTGEVKIRGKIASLLEVGTGFHPELTGRENVFLNGAILGMKRSEIQKKFDEIVDFAGVDQFIDTPVKRYSSGMYVRLGFAIAAHLDADILIIDEVLAVGDSEFQRRCIGKMENVSLEEGRTIIFVSHNMAAVAQLCTHGVLLELGKVKSIGETERIIAQYHASSSIPLGEISFPREAGQHGAGFLEVYLVDDENIRRAAFQHTSSISMVMNYWVDINRPGLRAGFKLMNSYGVVVMSAATSDSERLDGSVGAPGLHVLQARIPGSLLAPGGYTVELGLWSPGVGHHQHVMPAFVFEITVPDGMDGIGDEVLRPRLEWRVQT
jgi:lipopolysaccharide transport system ATP-binding protein